MFDSRSNIWWQFLINRPIVYLLFVFFYNRVKYVNLMTLVLFLVFSMLNIIFLAAYLLSFCFSTFDFFPCKLISLLLDWAFTKLIPVIAWIVHWLNDKSNWFNPSKENEMNSLGIGITISDFLCQFWSWREAGNLFS